MRYDTLAVPSCRLTLPISFSTTQNEILPLRKPSLG